MEKQFYTDNYGEVTVRNAMFDVDGTNLEEGIEIKSVNGEFDLLEIFGYYDIDDMNEDDVERLIEDHN